MVTGFKTIKFTDTTIDVVAKDGTDIGVESLSSGEKQLLRILVETLMAEESSIIIDEPELSIHIDWQRELVDAMRTLNPAAQIIIAPHSPEVMAKSKDDCVFRL